MSRGAVGLLGFSGLVARRGLQRISRFSAWVGVRGLQRILLSGRIEVRGL